MRGQYKTPKNKFIHDLLQLKTISAQWGAQPIIGPHDDGVWYEENPVGVDQIISMYEELETDILLGVVNNGGNNSLNYINITRKFIADEFRIDNYTNLSFLSINKIEL